MKYEGVRCDRSGRFIENHQDNGIADLFISAPWVGAWAGEGIEPLGGTGFQDLCDEDRVVVLRLLAKVLKQDVDALLASAKANNGGPLLQAVTPRTRTTGEKA